MQTGLRFEGTQMDTFGYSVHSLIAARLTLHPNCAEHHRLRHIPTPQINNPSYLDVLPSVQLRYSLAAEFRSARGL